MKSFFDRVVVEPLREVLRELVAFLPRLLTGLLVFLAGLALAWVVKTIVVRIIRLFKLDAALARAGVTDALKKMAVKDSPDKLIGRTFYWLVALIFFILALKVMRVPVIDQLLERFLLYLPSIFTALIILIIGWLLGNFLGRAALIASVNAGVRLSGLLGRGVRAVVMVLAVVMAFEQLGIGRNTVLAAFAIAFGGAVLALALALGLGGQGLARTFLEKRLKKDASSGDDGLKHL